MAPAPSAQTPHSALCPMVGSCGAAREVHRQHGWMDGMLITGLRCSPRTCSHHQHGRINTYNDTSAHHSPVTCDAPMRVHAQRRRLGHWVGRGSAVSVVGIGAADPHLSLTTVPDTMEDHVRFASLLEPLQASRQHSTRTSDHRPSAGDHQSDQVAQAPAVPSVQ
jgi:hypothetical protein